jgi:hypothetical protein
MCFGNEYLTVVHWMLRHCTEYNKLVICIPRLEFMQFKNCPNRADIFHHVDSDYLGLHKAALNEYYHYIETDNPRSASWNNIHEDCKLESIVTATTSCSCLPNYSFRVFMMLVSLSHSICFLSSLLTAIRWKILLFYLGSIITNDTRRTHKIKPKIIMEKAALNKKTFH